MQLPADRLLFPEKSATDAGNKAFIVNRIGDFGFMLGMFLLFRHFGTLDFATAFPQHAAVGRRTPWAISAP